MAIMPMLFQIRHFHTTTTDDTGNCKEHRGNCKEFHDVSVPNYADNNKWENKSQDDLK